MWQENSVELKVASKNDLTHFLYFKDLDLFKMFV